jgi:SAM-dependent methyltransferase
LLDSFAPYRRTNRILDIGCGAGFFLEAARSCGWEAYGTEFSVHALDIVRAKGLEVVQAPVPRNTFEPNYFDVVTSFEVVEHLRDPNGEADLMRHLLRLGGLLYCTTPNFNAATRRVLGHQWVVIEYPEHLCYYTHSSLRDWLGRHGFSVVDLRAEGFSPANLRRSLKPAVGATSGQGGDESFRTTVEQSRALREAKRLVNALLSAARLGDTLKGRFELRVKP